MRSRSAAERGLDFPPRSSWSPEASVLRQDKPAPVRRSGGAWTSAAGARCASWPDSPASAVQRRPGDRSAVTDGAAAGRRGGFWREAAPVTCQRTGSWNARSWSLTFDGQEVFFAVHQPCPGASSAEGAAPCRCPARRVSWRSCGVSPASPAGPRWSSAARPPGPGSIAVVAVPTAPRFHARRRTASCDRRPGRCRHHGRTVLQATACAVLVDTVVALGLTAGASPTAGAESHQSSGDDRSTAGTTAQRLCRFCKARSPGSVPAPGKEGDVTS